jgi:putative protein kinase ArgK-like GTPase of G3E family
VASRADGNHIGRGEQEIVISATQFYDRIGSVTAIGLISNNKRRALIAAIAARIAALSPGTFLRIAIDGVDGAGKTTFGDELADTLLKPASDPLSSREAVTGGVLPGLIRLRGAPPRTA